MKISAVSEEGGQARGTARCPEAELAGHDARVTQWVADGRVRSQAMTPKRGQSVLPRVTKKNLWAPQPASGMGFWALKCWKAPGAPPGCCSRFPRKADCAGRRTWACRGRCPAPPRRRPAVRRRGSASTNGGRARRGGPAVPRDAEDPQHKLRRPDWLRTGLLADESPAEGDRKVLGLPVLNYLIL